MLFVLICCHWLVNRHGAFIFFPVFILFWTRVKNHLWPKKKNLVVLSAVSLFVPFAGTCMSWVSKRPYISKSFIFFKFCFFFISCRLQVVFFLVSFVLDKLYRVALTERHLVECVFSTLLLFLCLANFFDPRIDIAFLGSAGSTVCFPLSRGCFPSPLLTS